MAKSGIRFIMYDRNARRFIFASILAPFVPSLVLFALGMRAGSFKTVFIISFIALLVSYLGLLLAGLPMLYFLRGSKWLNLTSLVLAGSLFGCVIWYSVLAGISRLLGSSVEFGLGETAVGAAFGFLVALCFGMVAGITWRPERSTPAGTSEKARR